MVIAFKPDYPNFLRAWIELRGYKVKRLAHKTGIPLRTMWEYIAERTAIEPDRIEALASALMCRPEQLVLDHAQVAGSEELNMKRRELLRLLSIASAALLSSIVQVL